MIVLERVYEIAVSSQFLALVIGIESGAKMIETESVVDVIKIEVNRLSKQYLCNAIRNEKADK